MYVQRSWKNFIKSAQVEEYSRNGKLIGALAGGGLAALMSALYYGKKSKKKQSFASRFLKGLAFTGIGAIGGGLAGMGLGRLIGNHIWFKRSLDAAQKRIVDENIPYRKGRVMYVNSLRIGMNSPRGPRLGRS